MTVKASLLICCATSLLLAGLSAGAADTQVFRWTDADGVVHFGDRPPSEDAQRLVVRTTDPTPPPPSSDTAAADAPPAGGAATNGDQNADDASAPAGDQSQTADPAAVRAANCEKARQINQTYQTSRRLYRQLPNGDREYLTDQELEDARTQAAAAVKEWCG